MKIYLAFGAMCAAYALSTAAVQAVEILHVGNADSADYSAFIAAQYPSATWVHKPSSTTGNDTIGGDLDRIVDFAVVGSHGGTGIKVRDYMQSFDLIVIGNGVTSTNFADAADWASITKPVLFHASLIARGIRTGMFTGDNNTSFVFGNPADTLRISASPLSDSIFTGVTAPTDLYNSTLLTSTDTITSAGTFGGGELITSLTDGITATPPRGIVYWNAGVTNGNGLILAAKRAFYPFKNLANSSINLTADGKIVLKNLIDQLLISTAPVFIPPSGLIAKSGVNSINLSWTGATGATSYNVKRSLTTGGPYTIISTPGAVTGTTYTDTGLTNGTTYYYVVSGVNASAAQSADSAQASAIPVPVLQPAKNILYVANADSATYQNFAANGEFANNTWTQKATGIGNDQVGGDLDRFANYTGLFGGTGISQRDYLQSFDLIIIGIPTTSGNLADLLNGASWASITKPILINSYVAARSIGGRMGMFSGDNAVTVTLNTPADTVRISSSALSNAIFNGVTTPTDLYSFLTGDLINGIALQGTGEIISRMAVGTDNHFGIVFWAANDLTAAGSVTANNRAFLPLKGSVDDLNADGKIVLSNLIKQLQLPQVTPAFPYGEWAANNISVLDPVALPGFNQDADNDGVNNGLEWIFGGNPLASDLAGVLPVSTGNATNGLTLVFNRASAPIASTTLSVQWGSDLAGLSNTIAVGASDSFPGGNSPTVDIDAPAAGQVTVRIPAANAVDGKVFARVKGQLNP